MNNHELKQVITNTAKLIAEEDKSLASVNYSTKYQVKAPNRAMAIAMADALVKKVNS